MTDDEIVCEACEARFDSETELNCHVREIGLAQ